MNEYTFLDGKQQIKVKSTSISSAKKQVPITAKLIKVREL